MNAPVAIVTGGARGIGRAIVAALISDNWQVAFTYRSDTAAARGLEETTGGSARGFVLDLHDPERPDALVREVSDALGPIVGLVNNAGARSEGLLAMTSDREWDELMTINQTGVFRCCRAVLPGMLHRRRGAIVSVSSLAATAGVAGQSAYAASKASILGLTHSLAREVGKRHVRVNAVLPGFVATDMTANLPEAAVLALRAHECLPRGVLAADVANAVAFLLSDRAAAITGQSLVVDAGTTA